VKVLSQFLEIRYLIEEMRSTLLFAALAAGACAKVVEKEVYVTDWTTTTVTETVTQWPTTTANVPNLVKQNTVVAESTSSSSSTSTSALPTVDLSKKTTAEPAPAPTQEAAVNNAGGATTWYSTTYWSIPAEPATAPAPTLSTSTSAAAAAAPTNAYQEKILYNHNVHRSNHSAASVTWSGSLESSARTLAERCVYKHDT
jgi:hypothetical protein